MDFRFPISDFRTVPPAPLPRRRCRAEIGDRRSAIGNAFTLIELMIVIGIIGVVVALGVPLFGVLTGARSQEAGQNLVAAAIGQARTIALSEGKYAGVLFYIDPATERTAMTVVVAGVGLEDPDPYDKYKGWVTGQAYRRSEVDAAGVPQYADRTIGLSSDASATFRGVTGANVYSPQAGNPYYSGLGEYFGNYKPVVNVWRAIQDASSTNANRPPRNGPRQNAAYFARIPAPGAAGQAGTAPTVEGGGLAAESSKGNFGNNYWSAEQVLAISPLDGAERQLLPLGVGVQLIIQPTIRSDLVGTAQDTAANRERYVRTGLIMFDPQGKVSVEGRTLPAAGTLGTQLGLTADVAVVPAGLGVVFYDRAAFRSVAGHTDADFLAQNTAATTTASVPTRIASSQTFYSDNVTAPMAAEWAEETWLDQNTVPLLINRYSGALSEAQ